MRLPATATVVLGNLVADDGDTLSPGPAVDPMVVPLADLRGSKFYDTLTAEMERWAAAVQSASEPVHNDGSALRDRPPVAQQLGQTDSASEPAPFDGNVWR